jgi:hypothetical protein
MAHVYTAVRRLQIVQWRTLVCIGHGEGAAAGSGLEADADGATFVAEEYRHPHLLGEHARGRVEFLRDHRRSHAKPRAKIVEERARLIS